MRLPCIPHLDEGAIWVRGTLPPSEGPSSSISFANQARVVMASFPEVTQVISQTGRPDDGTDTAGLPSAATIATRQWCRAILWDRSG